MSESDSIDLSQLQNLQFRPDWVEDLAQKDTAEVVWGKVSPDVMRREREGGDRFGGGGRGQRDDRRGGGGGGMGRGPRPGGPGGPRPGGPGGPRPGGPGGQRNFDNRGPRPGGPGGPRPDGPRQDGPPRGDRPQGDGRDFRGGPRPPHQGQDRRGPRPPYRGDGREGPAPLRGWESRLIADPRSVEAVARQIKASGRAYSVFDVARLFMQDRSRFFVRMRAMKVRPPQGKPEPGAEAPPAPPAPPEVYECRVDGSFWLSHEEAIRHVLRSPAIEKFYRAENVTLDAPKGKFTAIAVCGFSGIPLGPPNHHDFQRNVARLHRERFSNMALDWYKSRVVIEKDEATLARWQESQTMSVQYVPLMPRADGEGEIAAEAVVEVAEVAAEPAAEAVVEGAEVAVAAVEGGEGAVEGVAAAEAPVAAEVAAAAEPAVVPLKNWAEMEAHFRKHHAGEVIRVVNDITVPGNIPGRMLAPPLLSLLRSEVERQQRFPMELVQDLCRDLERAGLRFFKKDRKTTFVSRNRPHFLGDDVVLGDRVRSIVEMVRANPGITYTRLVSTLAPHIDVTGEAGAAVPSVETAAAAPSGEAPVAAEATSVAEPVVVAEEAAVVEAVAAPEETAVAETVVETVAAPEAVVAEEAPAVAEEVTAVVAEEAPVVVAEAGVEVAAGEEVTAVAGEAAAVSDEAIEQPAGEVAGEAGAEAPAAAPVVLSAEEIAILQDLRWLVGEGYVTEFQAGELFVLGRPPLPPAPPAPPKPRKKIPGQLEIAPDGSAIAGVPVDPAAVVGEAVESGASEEAGVVAEVSAEGGVETLSAADVTGAESAPEVVVAEAAELVAEPAAEVAEPVAEVAEAVAEVAEAPVAVAEVTEAVAEVVEGKEAVAGEAGEAGA